MIERVYNVEGKEVKVLLDIIAGSPPKVVIDVIADRETIKKYQNEDGTEIILGIDLEDFLELIRSKFVPSGIIRD
jgi:mannose/fructose-specific phosphotransferase system component IIA